MKVVLFCGGLGTRIREYSENIPKPMVPVGNQPIMWHVMQYYSQYGHKDFVLCLGYKANIIKEFFLNYNRRALHATASSPGFGSKVELLGRPEEEWRVTLLDTGIWRNIGQRLWAVRDHVKNEEMFLANYSDGLTDVDLDHMVETFKKSGKLACFLAVRPPLTYHLADIAEDGSRCRLPLVGSRRHLDQRRLLHLPTGDFRLHARGRGAGARALQPPYRRRSADGLSARAASGARWTRSGTGKPLRISSSRARCRGANPVISA